MVRRLHDVATIKNIFIQGTTLQRAYLTHLCISIVHGEGGGKYTYKWAFIVMQYNTLDIIAHNNFIKIFKFFY